MVGFLGCGTPRKKLFEKNVENNITINHRVCVRESPTALQTSVNQIKSIYTNISSRKPLTYSHVIVQNNSIGLFSQWNGNICEATNDGGEEERQSVWQIVFVVWQFTFTRRSERIAETRRADFSPAHSDTSQRDTHRAYRQRVILRVLMTAHSRPQINRRRRHTFLFQRHKWLLIQLKTQRGDKL